ncbi:MAG: hypothetical protein AABZ45_03355 [Pseudomonadota bacterium]
MYLIALSLLLAAATPTTPPTEPAASDAQATADDSQGDVNRLICRRVTAIGSRVSSTRQCATAAEWARMRESARQGTDRVQANRSTNGG